MSTGRKNVYHCQVCHDEVVTVDLDEGVTPFAIACRATAGCKGTMFSGFYPQWAQALPAAFEWFKPTDLSGYSAAMRDHLERGGLDMRQSRTPGDGEAETTA